MPTLSSTSHRERLATHLLRPVGDIDVRHDQGVFHHHAGSRGKKLIEAAVERDARHDGDKDGGRRRDQGKQRDDPHMQARGGAAAAARLQDQPELAADKGAKDQDDQQVDRQQRDDHLVGRRQRRQIGKDGKGDERADQRDDDRDPAQEPVFNPGRRSLCHSRFGGEGLIDAGHELPLMRAEGPGGRGIPPYEVMLFYNNVAGLRHFRGERQGLTAATVNLDVQVPDLLAQSVAINTQKVRRADLVAARGRQRRR